MSFATSVVKDGRGVVYRLDVSLDGFATIAYRYASQSFDSTGAAWYDPRIQHVGRLQRGFGNNRVAAISAVDIVLGNTDAGVDWLVDSATVETSVFKALFRLYVGVYDQGALAAYAAVNGGDASTLIDWQPLGEFMLFDPPKRKLGLVLLSLGDHVSGLFNELAPVPTFKDWVEGDATCSLFGIPVIEYFGDASGLSLPQIAFGENRLRLQPVAREVGVASTSKRPLICCITADSASATTGSDSGTVLIAEGLGEIFPSDGVYTAKRSVSLAKDGKNWKIIWLEVDIAAMRNLFGGRGVLMPIGSYIGTEPPQNGVDEYFEGVKSWTLLGAYPLSAITTKTKVSQNAVDVALDLVSSYSKGSGANVDTASFTRLKTTILNAEASGVVQPSLNIFDATSDRYFGSVSEATKDPFSSELRDVLTDLCQSFDFDIYSLWSGTIGVSAFWSDYSSQSVAPLSIDEERTKGFLDWVPAGNDRYPPYNRIYLESGGKTLGPFDNSAIITSWGRIIPIKLKEPWRADIWKGQNPWNWRMTEAKVRNRVKFLTDLSGLQFELGDFFYLNWTRNQAGPYSSTLFQVESIALLPDADNAVEIEAVKRDDLRTTLPYLLDNETLLTRLTGSGARTATVVDGSNIVTFSSGDLVADNVKVSDSLILKDSSEAATSFKRNKALSVVAISDATHLRVSDPIDALDFGAGAGIAVSEWEIRKSYITYPNANTDPGNYPDGSTMYGKVANLATNGVFSDATAANRLLEG